MTGAAAGALAAAAGAAAWLAVSALSGRSDPFDAPEYWALGLPTLAAACGLLGYAAPGRAWTIALAAAAGQFAAMIGRSGELGNLFPIGLVLLLVLALPDYGAARLGERWRLRGPAR